MAEKDDKMMLEVWNEAAARLPLRVRCRGTSPARLWQPGRGGGGGGGREMWTLVGRLEMLASVSALLSLGNGEFSVWPHRRSSEIEQLQLLREQKDSRISRPNSRET